MLGQAALGLPALAACVLAAASYPAKPADLTTPVQQRLAVNGQNGGLHTSYPHKHTLRHTHIRTPQAHSRTHMRTHIHAHIHIHIHPASTYSLT